MSFLKFLPDVLETFAVVKKERTLFHWKNCRIHLDVVEELGEFVEFEVMLQGEDDGQERMKLLCDYFNVNEEDIVLNSYSDLLTK